MRSYTVILAGWVAFVIAAGAAGDDDGHHHHHDRREDHRVARAALERGEILPLEKILAAVRPKLSDEIVGIKFEMHHGVWYYEFRTVDQHGHLHYNHANAKTAELETVEGHP